MVEIAFFGKFHDCCCVSSSALSNNYLSELQVTREVKYFSRIFFLDCSIQAACR